MQGTPLHPQPVNMQARSLQTLYQSPHPAGHYVFLAPVSLAIATTFHMDCNSLLADVRSSDPFPMWHGHKNNLSKVYV
jgi:hypothetical protein